ncbi:sensor histidine kinase [Peptostreptococcus faecalis]|uniref:sensor histidine kinase n=1 Tax=Peptostreptococcus faecalis TaxID=2045015 RepID=UPI000C79FEE6|nr:HAMP domain-containing sensor histidine kinase [Peptostreptococcus faecalis]
MALHLLLIIFLIIIVVFLLKITLIKKDIKSIENEFKEIIINESNTLLSTNSRDKQVRSIVMKLNEQLILLHEQRQQYLSGNQDLRDSVVNISHDLRTPLTAICSYLELLEDEEKTPAVEKYINIINGRVRVMRSLSEELFYYSISKTPKIDQNTEKVIINDILEESIAGFYTILNEHHIVPNIKMPEKKVVRNLNRIALIRVFSNVLENIIKYTDGDLDINLLETGELIFSNTTSEMDEIKVGKIFNRYYTVKSGENSTGMGLSITKALIEQMDGFIYAEYKNNKLKIHITF